MAIMASDTGGGGDFSPMPAGNHIAICDMVVDLGKQRIDYNGDSKVQHKIYIRWQTPEERLKWTNKDGMDCEGPRVIGKTYTLSLHENATLRGHLESWRGRAFTPEEREGFDVAKLLGAPCMLNVIHEEKNGRTYANVVSIGKLPKGMNAPTPENGLVIYDNEHPQAYEGLPEWLQKKIDDQVKDTPPTQSGASIADDLNDDIPF